MKNLGPTGYKDVCSFCVAVTIDPVVNVFKPRHFASLAELSMVLRGEHAGARLHELIASCAGGEEVHRAIGHSAVAGAEMLAKSRMLHSFLAVLSSSAALFEDLRVIVADVLLSITVTIESYHTPRESFDGSARRYQDKWGDPLLSPVELRARFLTAYPHTPEVPQVTGAFVPGFACCRPNAFATTDKVELRTCANNYMEVPKFYL